VASCLEILPDDVEAALAHHSEAGDRYRLPRAEIRDRLLCDPDGEPRATGTHAAEPD
jgi:hypothetical protein